jgi:hypothetical protein
MVTSGLPEITGEGGKHSWPLPASVRRAAFDIINILIYLMAINNNHNKDKK